MISRARSSNFGLGCGSCTHLTVTFSCSILVLHGLSEPSGWPTAGRLEVNKCTVFCRNIKRNIKRYWISRRICRSISCWVAARSMVAWRGPEHKQTMSAYPRPGVRRDPLRWSGGHPCRPLTPCALVGRLGHSQVCEAVVVTPGSGSGVAGGGSTPVLAPRRMSVAGVAAPPPGARSRHGHVAPLSCAMRGVASPALRGGFLLGPAAGRAARQRRAPAGPGKRRGASGCRAVVHGPPGGAASCGEGAPAGVASVGHREARAPASVSSNPTRVCRRRRTASARASLPLFAAPDAQRSAPTAEAPQREGGIYATRLRRPDVPPPQHSNTTSCLSYFGSASGFSMPQLLCPHA